MVSMYFREDVRGLPLGLFPFTFRCRTIFAVVSSSRLITCPNHLNWSVCMVSMIGFILNSSYNRHSVLCLFLVTPLTNLRTFISAAVILLFSFLVSIQYSCPYNSIGLRMVMWIRSTVIFSLVSDVPGILTFRCYLSTTITFVCILGKEYVTISLVSMDQITNYLGTFILDGIPINYDPFNRYVWSLRFKKKLRFFDLFLNLIIAC